MVYFLNLNNFNFNKPINYFSLKIFKFNNIIIVCVISFFFLYILVIFLFIIFYRKNLKNKKNNIKEKLKKYFILINIFLIFLLIFFSTFYLIKLKKNKFSFLTIKIIGYQWRWYYHYIYGLGKNINYFSNIFINFYQILNISSKNNFYLQEVDNKLVLPVNKTIRLIFTSNDVIHSWFIPSLLVKQDAIPGFYRDLYFNSKSIGKYKGFCTELCGKYHSYMPIIINVISLLSYKKWVLAFFYKKFLKFNY